jgi:hypothetical protein
MSIEKAVIPTKPINPTNTKKPSLVMRAKQRRAELAAAMAALPADALQARSDLELAITAADGYLTGDLEHLADATAKGLSNWLEETKHFAEKPASPIAR